MVISSPERSKDKKSVVSAIKLPDKTFSCFIFWRLPVKPLYLWHYTEFQPDQSCEHHNRLTVLWHKPTAFYLKNCGTILKLLQQNSNLKYALIYIVYMHSGAKWFALSQRAHTLLHSIWNLRGRSMLIALTGQIWVEVNGSIAWSLAAEFQTNWVWFRDDYFMQRESSSQ